MSNLLAIVAIAISLICIGLLFGSNLSLQNEIRITNENQIKQTLEFENNIRDLNEKLDKQSEQIDSVYEELDAP